MKRSVASGWNFLLSLEEGKANGEKRPKLNNNAPEIPTVTGLPQQQGPSPSSSSASPSGLSPQSGGSDELLHLNDGAKLVICITGKPGRGKTHIACKIARYVSWLGYRTKHFETANYICKKYGAVDVESFFDPNNAKAVEERKLINQKGLDDMFKWLKDGGQVAMFDATNGTLKRREMIVEQLNRNFGDIGNSFTYRLLWIECECENKQVVEQNFIQTRMRIPDYQKMDDKTALMKFRRKEEHYAHGYVGLVEAAKMQGAAPIHKEFSYVKIVDFGETVVAHRVLGFLESKLVSFCINLHTKERTIYLVRHGQSKYNVDDKLGGDSELTPFGAEFANHLADFMTKQAAEGYGMDETAVEGDQGKDTCALKNLSVWTSTLQRSIQTGENVPCHTRVSWRLLSEIDAGVCEGMTYAEIAKKMPLEYAERQRNKLTWRYPRGESYMDVLHRLEPVIFELERQRRPILIVGHRAVLRCLYSYLVGIETKRVCFLPFPLHTVIKLTTSQHGWKETRFALGPDVGDRGAHESDVAAARANTARKQAAAAAMAKQRKLAQQ